MEETAAAFFDRLDVAASTSTPWSPPTGRNWPPARD